MTATLPEITLDSLFVSDGEALRLVQGWRVTRDGRTMDPKAQLVGELVKRLRPLDQLPTPEESRQQFRKMVELMDNPGPGVAAVEDLTCPGPAGTLRLRLWRPKPKGDTPLPLLFFIHGGGWIQGDLDTHANVCAKLAAWSGSLVLAVDYRLAPADPFPAAVEDCLAVWRWLAGETETLGADPARLCVGGDSAGGNLAAVLAQSVTSLGLPLPAAQLLIYPSLELGWDLASHRSHTDAYVLPKIRLDWYSRLYLPNPTLFTDPRVSPLRTPDLAGQPPTMIVIAGFDPLRDDGLIYAGRLAAAGVTVHLREWPGQLHAFVCLTKVIPQGDLALQECADWLTATLGTSTHG
ncbi:MAG: alpha/beta hydrolase [Geminicoccaceae bacterium]